MAEQDKRISVEIVRGSMDTVQPTSLLRMVRDSLGPTVGSSKVAGPVLSTWALFEEVQQIRLSADLQRGRPEYMIRVTRLGTP